MVLFSLKLTLFFFIFSPVFDVLWSVEYRIWVTILVVVSFKGDAHRSYSLKTPDYMRFEVKMKIYSKAYFILPRIEEILEDLELPEYFSFQRYY